MISLSVLDIRAMLECEHLSERERVVVGMRYSDGLPTNTIGRRLGVSQATVTSCLTRARNKVRGAQTARAASSRRPGSARNRPIDAAWYERQVAYVRSLAHDEEHQRRYLRGLALCQGQAVADEIERRASAS